MMIDLNSWEARIVLEALRSLDAEWKAMIDSTADEDIQSEYGNGLGQLDIAGGFVTLFYGEVRLV